MISLSNLNVPTKDGARNANPSLSLALVIPTLNEAGNLTELFDRIREAMKLVSIPYEIILVDDNSVDGTPTIARAYAERDCRIHVFVRREERGLAGAITHGWAQTDATLLGVLDADLQHPPELLPVLLDRVRSGNDIAIASRYSAKNSISVENWDTSRQLISRCGTLLTLPLQRWDFKISDPLSGYFIVHRRCIEGLQLQKKGFKILFEILVKGKIRNPAEVPFRFANRQWGKSKGNVRIGLQYLTLLGKLSGHALLHHHQH